MARRPSHQTKLVFQAFLDAPSDEVYGLKLARATGVGTGSCYMILRRLEREALVKSHWEVINASDAGRPPRRYYSLTGLGRKVAQEVTASDRAALRDLVPGWAAA